ncbi:MAG: alpha/beta hydrolase [Wenzhouxiangellaceae bacterium]
MYVITNRRVDENGTGLEQFGKTPNEKGNNELRLARVTRRGRGYAVEFLEDVLDPARARELIDEFELDLNADETQYASLEVACETVRRAREHKRHILLYVHGYNNDMRDVMQTAFDLEARYEVEVLAFSWPANGGGVGGKLSYLSDKRDARASTGALERTLKKLHEYLMLISESSRIALREKARSKFPDNAERRDALYAELLRKDCPFTINALFHSMGNYLYKQMLKSSINEGNALIFDNVVLCQADTNNAGHPNWVDNIAHNRRVFVTINENDFALRLSRIKPGDAQRARLGHYIKRLESRVAHYVNLTEASWVQQSHSPFADPTRKNDKLRNFFRRAFTGEPAEESLRYRPEGNWYELPR